MLARLHLVRHGEVHNPDHVVYADLPGFRLSPVGADQAAAAGRHLAAAGVVAVWTSPLLRAVQTAEFIADASGVEVTVDDRLTEWALGSRWAGVVWEDLSDRFPGELEAYLASPHRLSFAPESIAAVADRMTAAVTDMGARFPQGKVAVVSHQDPVQALRLHLTGRPLSSLQTAKPGHACVVTLAGWTSSWSEDGFWCPEQSTAPFPPVGDTLAP